MLDETQANLHGGGRRQVQLDFNADEPRVRLLTVEVLPQAEETLHENNRMGLVIHVDQSRWRLLYLEGYPNWDFRFLDHALRRDHGLEVALVMEAALPAADNQDLATAAKLPEDAAGFAAYNCVMLGDITPALLPPRLQQALARAVEEEGLGLIIQAGPIAMPHAFLDGPLRRILPVRMERLEGQAGAPAGVQAPAFAPFQMAVTPAGSRHPAFRLYDSASRNRSVWSRMPSFFWAAAAVEPAPGASLLAEVNTAGRSRPLIAEHFAGAGRVLFVGTDSTYRWRRNIGDHLFYRFWGQAIRRVARSTQRTADSDWIETYPTRVAPGDTVSVELYAVDESGQPLPDAQTRVRITGANSSQTQTVVLERAGRPGHFQGDWRTSDVGEFTFTYIDKRGNAVNAAVRVAQSGQEFLRPDVDRDTLGAIADLTGGRLLELDRVAELPDRIKGEPLTFQRAHEEELWDNWLTLVLLVVIYCTDVFVRRMSGLT